MTDCAVNFALAGQTLPLLSLLMVMLGRSLDGTRISSSVTSSLSNAAARGGLSMAMPWCVSQAPCSSALGESVSGPAWPAGDVRCAHTELSAVSPNGTASMGSPTGSVGAVGAVCPSDGSAAPLTEAGVLGRIHASEFEASSDDGAPLLARRARAAAAPPPAAIPAASSGASDAPSRATMRRSSRSERWRMAIAFRRLRATIADWECDRRIACADCGRARACVPVSVAWAGHPPRLRSSPYPDVAVGGRRDAAVRGRDLWEAAVPGRSRAAVDGRRRLAVDGRRRLAVAGRARVAVDGRDFDAVAGRARDAVAGRWRAGLVTMAATDPCNEFREAGRPCCWLGACRSSPWRDCGRDDGRDDPPRWVLMDSKNPVGLSGLKAAEMGVIGTRVAAAGAAPGAG